MACCRSLFQDWRPFVPRNGFAALCALLSLASIAPYAQSSEVADDATPFVMTFRSYGSVKYNDKIDLGGKQRVWLTKIISLKQMIARSGFNEKRWNALKALQMVIYERLYADGDKLEFKISDIAFLKFNRPVIRNIDCSNPVILPAQNYIINISGFGFAQAVKNKNQLLITITDQKKQVVMEHQTAMSSHPQVVLDLSSLAAGSYKITIAIKDKTGSIISNKAKKINLIRGYIS